MQTIATCLRSKTEQFCRGHSSLCLSVTVSLSLSLSLSFSRFLSAFASGWRGKFFFVCVCRGSVVSRRTKLQQGNNETKAFDVVVVVVAAAVGYSLPSTLGW